MKRLTNNVPTVKMETILNIAGYLKSIEKITFEKMEEGKIKEETFDVIQMSRLQENTIELINIPLKGSLVKDKEIINHCISNEIPVFIKYNTKIEIGDGKTYNMYDIFEVATNELEDLQKDTFWDNI